jgi:hypothetical protein
MSIFSGHFWRSLVPIMQAPLSHQPFLILAYLVRTVVWVVTALIVCTGRFAAVVVGQSAFVAGIVMCLVGYGYVGAPVSVIGLVASRLAA